jgi:hypothetical protein
VIHLFLLINKLFQLLRTNSMAHHQKHKKLELKPEPAKEAITDSIAEPVNETIKEKVIIKASVFLLQIALFALDKVIIPALTFIVPESPENEIKEMVHKLQDA